LLPLKGREVEKFKEYAYKEPEVKMIYTSFEEEALIRGREEGKEEGKIDVLIKILGIKYGDVPSWLLSKIEDLQDIEMLDRLIEQAVVSDDIGGFLANSNL